MKKRWSGRVYLGRDENGKQLYEWIGRFDTKRERDAAVAQVKYDLAQPQPKFPSCDAYVDRYLADYERKAKYSSYVTQKQRLSKFREDFAGRALDISRAEAKDWAKSANAGCIQAIISLYNHAIDEDDLPLERNPFRKLAPTTRGRSEEPPPTEEEMELLLASCAALKHYAPTARAMLRFAVYSLMRPSELFALEWTDIDFEAMRIDKSRRVFQGTVDVPKTGRKVIALTPPARDAIIGLPRDTRYVFPTKTGKRLAASTWQGYWTTILAQARLDFDFYHATKHYGVHLMWTKLGMSKRAIAAQAGWNPSTVDKLLSVYGHGDVGALEEVDAAFASKVTPLRKVEGGTQS